MQVTTEPLDPCQVALTIEVEGPKVVHAVDRAYKEYAKYVAVPGFRKGKAPMSYVRQRVPEGDVRQRAAELLVEPAYEEAIAQEAIQPYAPARFELVQMDLTDAPFIFKAVVPLPPQVTLGEYAGLPAEHKNYTLADADVEAQMEKMRERAAEYPIAERPVQNGDLVIADVGAVTDVRPEAAAPRATMIEVGNADNIPGFDAEIVGLASGDEKTFPLTYPEDYPDTELAGETAEFTVKIKEVREKQLPDLDDALAAKLSNDRYPTIDALRGSLREDMERSLHQSADSETDAALVDKAVQNATIAYPPILTEAEVDAAAKQLTERLQQEKMTIDDYLQRTGKTREQVLAEMRDAADQRIRIGLVLAEIATKENLTLTDVDIDAALAEQAAQQGASPAAMRAYLESNNGLDALRNRAQTRKVLDFLRGAAVLTEVPIAAGEMLADDDDEDDTESEE